MFKLLLTQRLLSVTQSNLLIDTNRYQMVAESRISSSVRLPLPNRWPFSHPEHPRRSGAFPHYGPAYCVRAKSIDARAAASGLETSREVTLRKRASQPCDGQSVAKDRPRHGAQITGHPSLVCRMRYIMWLRLPSSLSSGLVANPLAFIDSGPGPRTLRPPKYPFTQMGLYTHPSPW